MKPILDERRVCTLYYNPDINRFVDVLDRVIHDIYRLVLPAQVEIFKEYRNMYLIPDRSNTFWVELIYLEESKDLMYY